VRPWLCQCGQGSKEGSGVQRAHGGFKEKVIGGSPDVSAETGAGALSARWIGGQSKLPTLGKFG
jgi:hypothetical protein